MRGKWDLDAYNLTEANSILEAVSCKVEVGELNV